MKISMIHCFNILQYICGRNDKTPVAGKSTLNGLELGHELDEDSKNRYSKITWDAKGIEELLCQLFLDSFEKPPETLILDFDAAGIPIHGDQQRRFFTDITITTAAFRSMCSVMILP